MRVRGFALGLGPPRPSIAPATRSRVCSLGKGVRFVCDGMVVSIKVILFHCTSSSQPTNLNVLLDKEETVRQ